MLATLLLAKTSKSGQIQSREKFTALGKNPKSTVRVYSGASVMREWVNLPLVTLASHLKVPVQVLIQLPLLQCLRKWRMMAPMFLHP